MKFDFNHYSFVEITKKSLASILRELEACSVDPQRAGGDYFAVSGKLCYAIISKRCCTFTPYYLMMVSFDN